MKVPQLLAVVRCNTKAYKAVRAALPGLDAIPRQGKLLVVSLPPVMAKPRTATKKAAAAKR